MRQDIQIALLVEAALVLAILGYAATLVGRFA